jgi:hypothetical protein
MDVTVLAITDCPGAVLLEDRLAAVAAGLPGLRISRRLIASEAEAAAAGMCGSPTLLVGGSVCGTGRAARPGMPPVPAGRRVAGPRAVGR